MDMCLCHLTWPKTLQEELLVQRFRKNYLFNRCHQECVPLVLASQFANLKTQQRYFCDQMVVNCRFS